MQHKRGEIILKKYTVIIYENFNYKTYYKSNRVSKHTFNNPNLDIKYLRMPKHKYVVALNDQHECRSKEERGKKI